MVSLSPDPLPLTPLPGTLLLLLTSLDKGYVLKDATPFNIQFIGAKPLFVDIASFEAYQEGQPWRAYYLFCRTFLNPLLLEALTGVRFQSWLRGSLAGISPSELGRLLPWRSRLAPSVFTNVVLQGWLERKFGGSEDGHRALGRVPIGKKQLIRLATKLNKAISRLKSRARPSDWARYDLEDPYSGEARRMKEHFVERALAERKPGVVWDLGCNNGRFSVMAARHANYVVAMDSDVDAVGQLYQRSGGQNGKILPLVVDFLDPSPERGWAQRERRGLLQRGAPDMVLALALTHHLAISGGVPLRNIIA